MKSYSVTVRGVKLHLDASIEDNDVEIHAVFNGSINDISELLSSRVEDEIAEAVRQQDAEERAELRQTKGEYL